MQSFLFIIFLLLNFCCAVPNNGSGSSPQCRPGKTELHGRKCTTTCNQDRPGGDYKSVKTGCLEDCVRACASESRCLTAQYHEKSGYCYLKEKVNSAKYTECVDSIDCSPKCSTTTKTTTTCPPKTTTTTTTKTTPTTTTTTTTRPPTTTTTTTTMTTTTTTTTTPVCPAIPSATCMQGNSPYTVTNSTDCQCTYNYTCNQVPINFEAQATTAPCLEACLQFIDFYADGLGFAYNRVTMECRAYNFNPGSFQGYNTDPLWVSGARSSKACVKSDCRTGSGPGT